MGGFVQGLGGAAEMSWVRVRWSRGICSDMMLVLFRVPVDVKESGYIWVF